MSSHSDRQLSQHFRKRRILWLPGPQGSNLFKNRMGNLTASDSSRTTLPSYPSSCADKHSQRYKPSPQEAHSAAGASRVQCSKLTASDSRQTEPLIIIISLLVAQTALSETCFCLQVHVILFGVDSGDAEGIYSLRALTDDDTVPTDTIVAFECRQDAERYATLLEATMSHKPDVVPISPGTASSAGAARNCCHQRRGPSSLTIHALVPSWRAPEAKLWCIFCQVNGSGGRLQSHSRVGFIARKPAVVFVLQGKLGLVHALIMCMPLVCSAALGQPGLHLQHSRSCSNLPAENARHASPLCSWP